MLDWDTIRGNKKDDEEESYSSLDWDSIRGRKKTSNTKVTTTNKSSSLKDIGTPDTYYSQEGTAVSPKYAGMSDDEILAERRKLIVDTPVTQKAPEVPIVNTSNNIEKKENPLVSSANKLLDTAKNINTLKDIKKEVDKKIYDMTKVNANSTPKIHQIDQYTLPKAEKIASNSEMQEVIKNGKEITVDDINLNKDAINRNKNIDKGGTSKTNEAVKTVLNNIRGGVMNTAAGLADVALTATALGIKGLESMALMGNQKEAASTLNNWYDNIIKTEKKLNDKASYESKVTSQLNDSIIKMAGQVTNTITEMIADSAIGFAIGGIEKGNKLGTVIQGLSVGGRSTQEVLEENKDKILPATVTGIAKGYTAYLTEKMFDANILTRKSGGSISDKIDDIIFDKLNSKFGREFANKTVGVIGENLEELVEDNVDNVIDKLINDKDFPEMQEWLNNTTETAKVTTLSTIIMSLLGLGGENFSNKEYNIIERKAQEIIDKGGYAIQYDKDNVLNNFQMKPVFTTSFNSNGEIESINVLQGKPIENVNKYVKVDPIIIKNSDGNYNIIDGRTGVLMDSTPYNSLIQAETEFDKKMLNLKQEVITSINKKVSEVESIINNKTEEIINNIEQAELTQNDILNNETTNYITDDVKSNPEQNIEDNTIKETKIEKKVKEYIENNDITPKINMTTTEVADIKTKNIKQMEAYKKAKDLFSTLHKRKFKNKTEDIYVTNSDIKESVNKTYTYTDQRKLLKENLSIYSYLDTIIENGIEISTENELKGRKKYQDWKYYITPVKIDGKNYIVEFDTVKREDGQRHFRIERLYETNKEGSTTVVPTKKSATRFTVEPSNINNSITQKNTSVKNDTTVNNKNMQEKKNNTNKQQIIEQVKYNPDGKEIKDTNYVNFLADRYIDNKNISGIETDTKYIESLSNKTKKEIINDLFDKIKDKRFIKRE